MSIRTPFLSTLVLLCSAFPAQLFRIGMTGAGRRGSAAGARRVAAALWLPAAFLLAAALVWYVAPTSGVLVAPAAWWWVAVAALAGVAAPAVEIGVGAAVALARRRRVRRIALHERWAGGTGAAVATVCVVAVAEEVIFRGVGLHLLVRDLGWWPAAAVAVTAAVYGANHLYFGGLTVLQKTVTGLLYGGLFLAAGHSLLVPAVAHAVQNLVVLLALPRLVDRRPARSQPPPVPAAAAP